MKLHKIPIMALLLILSFNIFANNINSSIVPAFTLFSADPFYQLEKSKRASSILAIEETNEYQLLSVADISLKELALQEKYNIVLPNGNSYNIIPTTKKFYGDGFFTVSGYVEINGEQSSHLAVFTYTKEGLIGSFYLPEGLFKAQYIDGINVLYKPSHFERNTSFNQFKEDQNFSKNYRQPDIKTKLPKQTKAGFGNDTVINVGVIISDSAGDFNLVKQEILDRVAFGNTQLSTSNIKINLNLQMIARAKQEFEQNLNQGTNIAADKFIIERENLIDLQDPNIEVFPSTLTNLNIHQLVLVIGSNATDNCGLSETPPTGFSFGNLSIIRVDERASGGNCPDSTLVHEISHNITVLHDDGACKSFNQGNTLCEYIPPPIFKSSTQEWHSIMLSNAQDSVYFTGGANNNIVDTVKCLVSDNDVIAGICNVNPLSAHDTAGKLNAGRVTAGQLYIPISLATPPVQPDQYDDVPASRAYDDDIAGDSVVYDGTNQTHNFHDSGDQDWIIFSLGHGQGASINYIQQGLAAAHVSAYQLANSNPVEVSPGRWNIPLSSLTLIASDTSTGNNSVLVQNTTGVLQTYVIKATSSGPVGTDTDYIIQTITNNPQVSADLYDDVPTSRAYDDDIPGDSVVFDGTPQTHNFHDNGDQDWIIFSLGNGQGANINTTQLGVASAQLTAYQLPNSNPVEVSPGRWNIPLSTLILIDSDTSTGNNSVVVQNTTGAIQTYVIKASSSGPTGVNTDYQFTTTPNNPF
jgi:hypothetical protein